MRRLERGILMTGDTYERAIRGGAAFPVPLVGPHLRRDNKDAVEGGRQHVNVGRHVQVVINLVLPIEVGDAPHDGMPLIDKVNACLAFQPFGLFVAVPAPRSALNLFSPFMLVAAYHAVVNHDQTAAAAEELLE